MVFALTRVGEIFISLMIFAEPMAFAHDPLAGLKGPDKDGFDELVGAHRGEAPVKRYAGKIVDAVWFQENGLFLEGREDRLSRIRIQNQPRMRFEGNDDARKAVRLGAVDDLFYKHVMPLMDAVEIPDGNDAALDRQIRGFV